MYLIVDLSAQAEHSPALRTDPTTEMNSSGDLLRSLRAQVGVRRLLLDEDAANFAELRVDLKMKFGILQISASGFVTAIRVGTTKNAPLKSTNRRPA